ncbi:MAG: hypothetical protein WAU47_07510 [Desulfobaccales bacterium]
MCRNLVGKVSRYRELAAVADPNTLALFEEWLEALEEELAAMAREGFSLETEALSQKMGLSPEGVDFLLVKLRQSGRLPEKSGT